MAVFLTGVDDGGGSVADRRGVPVAPRSGRRRLRVRLLALVVLVSLSRPFLAPIDGDGELPSSSKGGGAAVREWMVRSLRCFPVKEERRTGCGASR